MASAVKLLSCHNIENCYITKTYLRIYTNNCAELAHKFWMTNLNMATIISLPNSMKIITRGFFIVTKFCDHSASPTLAKFSLWLIFLFYKQKDKRLDLTSRTVNSWLMRKDRAMAGTIRNSILQTKHCILPHNSYNSSYSDIRTGIAILFILHSMYSWTYSAVYAKIQMKVWHLYINRWIK
jgi:hypothetical protein